MLQQPLDTLSINSHLQQEIVIDSLALQQIVESLVVHDQSSLWLSVVVGIGSSLVASSLFILILFQMKPRVEISEKIAKTRDITGDTIYLFKFINRSHIFRVYQKVSITDIKAQLLLLEFEVVPGGNNLNSDTLKLEKEQLWHVPYKGQKGYDNAEYARLLGTKQNLSGILSENSMIEISIESKHSLSGFSKVYKQRYYAESDIINGRFEYGDSFEIR